MPADSRAVKYTCALYISPSTPPFPPSTGSYCVPRPLRTWTKKTSTCYMETFPIAGLSIKHGQARERWLHTSPLNFSICITQPAVSLCSDTIDAAQQGYHDSSTTSQISLLTIQAAIPQKKHTPLFKKLIIINYICKN